MKNNIKDNINNRKETSRLGGVLATFYRPLSSTRFRLAFRLKLSKVLFLLSRSFRSQYAERIHHVVGYLLVYCSQFVAHAV